MPSVLKAGVVPYIHVVVLRLVNPLAQEIANKFGLLLIDVRLAECDPTEIGDFLTLMKFWVKLSITPLQHFPPLKDPKHSIQRLDESHQLPLQRKQVIN